MHPGPSATNPHAGSRGRIRPSWRVSRSTPPTFQTRYSWLLSRRRVKTILSAIGDTAISFSNGVTHSTGPHPDHASFLLQSAVPTVVSRSTNEVWHWFAKSLDGHAFVSPISIATNGPGVAYSILDEPVAPWTDDHLSNTNVWVSALDFVTKTNACQGSSSKEVALSSLTQYLFGKLGLRYELSSGGSSFTKFTAADWRTVGASRPLFSATEYMNNVSSGSAGSLSPVSSVNCYDQAAALSTFGTVIGIDVRYRYLIPFGYINLTNLVGWGSCNNPIPGSCGNTNLVVGADDIYPNRSYFGNHAFCSFSGMVFDACAGPALGDLSVAQYLETTIDHSSSTASAHSETNSLICGVGKTPFWGFIKRLE